MFPLAMKKVKEKTRRISITLVKCGYCENSRPKSCFPKAQASSKVARFCHDCICKVEEIMRSQMERTDRIIQEARSISD
jgi:hypothetical protein